MLLGKGNYRPACISSFHAGFKKHECVYPACLCLQTLAEGWGGRGPGRQRPSLNRVCLWAAQADLGETFTSEFIKKDRQVRKKEGREEEISGAGFWMIFYLFFRILQKKEMKESAHFSLVRDANWNEKPKHSHFPHHTDQDFARNTAWC